MNGLLGAIGGSIGNAYKGIVDAISKKKADDAQKAANNIVAPIPPENVMTQGWAYQVKQADARQRMAQKQPPAATPTPLDLTKILTQSHPSIGNLPPKTASLSNPNKPSPYGEPAAPPTSKGVTFGGGKPKQAKNRINEVINIIRTQRPEYKGSDNDIKKLYKRYGESLLSDINKSQQPIVPKLDQLPSVTPNPNEPINPDFEKILNEVIFPITRQAGIPDSVAAAQAAVEGGRAQSDAAQRLNNYYGIMDWPNGQRQLKAFNSPQESVQAYVNTVKKLVPNVGQLPDDLSVLEALQSGPQRYEGDQEDPMAYVRTVTNTPEFRRYMRLKK